MATKKSRRKPAPTRKARSTAGRIERAPDQMSCVTMVDTPPFQPHEAQLSTSNSAPPPPDKAAAHLDSLSGISVDISNVTILIRDLRRRLIEIDPINADCHMIAADIVMACQSLANLRNQMVESISNV